MKRINILIIFLLFGIVSICQNSFELLIDTESNDKPTNVIEDEYGNFIIIGIKNYYENITLIKQNGIIIKLNQEGNLIKQKEINLKDTNNIIFNIHITADNNYLLLGAVAHDTLFAPNTFWVSKIDTSFNTIWNKYYQFPNNYYAICDFISHYDNQNNIIITGVAFHTENDSDIFMFKLNQNGDSTKLNIFSQEYYQLAWDFIERKDSSGYFVFAFGYFDTLDYPGKLLIIDTSFNIINIDSIPRGINQVNTARWLNDSIYILSGKKFESNPAFIRMGILSIKNTNNVIHENYFGMEPDTITYPGAYNNLDITLFKEIYYGGMANVVPSQYPWQHEPSWVLLTKSDSSFNPYWLNYYGGDAFYILNGLRTTSDYGCIMICSRYDYTTTGNEYDIYILKVDSQGLITNINENAKINISNAIVYPNPGRNQIVIKTPKENSFFELFDITGKILLKKFISAYSTELNVSHLPSGMYFYRIHDNEKIIESGKWVKI